MAQPAHASGEESVTGYLGLLRVPQLPAIVMAHLISVLGTVAAEVALSLLVYTETRSALYAAMAVASAFVPQAVSGSLLSAVAERFPPRSTLTGANLLSAALAGLMVVNGMPVGVELLMAAALGAVVPLYNGVRAATLTELLDPVAYVTARSLIRVISQSSLVFGFLFGGLLTAAFGARAVILGNAMSFVIAAALLRLGTAADAPGQQGHPGPRAILGASTECLRYTFRERRIRLIVLSFWLPPSFASAGSGLAVAYAAQSGGGAVAAGLLFTAFAAGAVGAEVVGARLPVMARRRAVPFLMLLVQVPMLGFAAKPPIVAAALLRLLSGCGLGYLQGLDLELIRSLQKEMRRRAMIVLSSGVMASQGVMIVAAGALSEMVSPGLVIAVFGVAGTIISAILIERHHQDRRRAAEQPGELRNERKG